nr:MarR family transcriptional regulator [Chloroflexota bacterium]
MILLENDLGFLLGRTDRAMRNYLLHRLQPLGVTFQQLQVLVGLSEGDAISQDALAKRMFLEPGFITRMLQRLEQDGFVARVGDEQDARKRLVLLTPKGRELCEKVETVRTAALQDALRSLSEEEVNELQRLLNRLFATVRDPQQ